MPNNDYIQWDFADYTYILFYNRKFNKFVFNFYLFLNKKLCYLLSKKFNTKLFSIDCYN